MKKFLCALCVAVALSVACVAFTPSQTFAEEATDESYKQSDAYKFMADFVSSCPDRNGLTNEEKAANYLKQEFEKISPLFNVRVIPISQPAISYNVEVTFAPAHLSAEAKAKHIIIGAHYDSKGEGANDNASGIAAMYLVMKQFAAQAESLPCTVIFVAFGGEEQGMWGSREYISSMTAVDRDNTLIMFNFDVIANGDNLYVFCENKPTDMENLVLSSSSDCAVKIYAKPYAVGTFAFDYNGYGYYETIQNTDFTPFRLQGIPTVAYFSGNYSAAIWDYSESSDPIKHTMNTASDTLENLEKFNGGVFVKRIESVAKSTVDTVLSPNFMTVAGNARNQMVNNSVMFNSLWPRLTVLLATAVLALLALAYNRKLQKRSIMGTAEVKDKKVFSSPDADDIFNFDDGKTNNKDKDDIDDIFTLKK